MRTAERTSKTDSPFLRIALQTNEAISLNTHLVQLTPLFNCNDVKQWAASFYLACTAPSGLVYYIIKDFFFFFFSWNGNPHFLILLRFIKVQLAPLHVKLLFTLLKCVCVWWWWWWWGGTGSAFSLWEQNKGQMVVQSEVYRALLIISVSFVRNNSADSLPTTIFIQRL